jgi:Holliday junction resolvase
MRGELDERTVTLLASQQGATAKALHDSVADALDGAGWAVRREFWVRDNGSGKSGRIDLVARRGAEVVAIELDKVDPRKKSIFKLLSVSRMATCLVVLTRR